MSPCPMSGVLVLDKPAGPTSFQVVSRVKQLLRADRVGHAGTLDPGATGVLVVCIGEAVKLQQFLTEGDKAYLATVVFGVATDTEDSEGREVARGDASAVGADAIRAVLPRFLGTVEQVPPMYSAVRVAGRRLHRSARAGEIVERAPRRVAIRALELLEVLPSQPDDGLVRARIAVRCGKGTYVRTLAADLGRALAVPAHLGALRRTEAGPFRVEEAVTLPEAERLAAADRGALAARLVPLAEALRGTPAVLLSAAEARDLGHGKAIPAAESAGGGLCRALDPEGRLLAVCDARGGMLHPARVFPAIR